MTSLEERVSRLEGAVEQMNERLGNIEQNLLALRTEMQQGYQSLQSEMRDNFRWTIGIVLVTWITVIGTVLGALLTR